MAAEFVGGVLLEAAVSELSDLIIITIKKTLYFKSELKKMQETVVRMRPVFKDMEKLNKELDRREEETKTFMNLLKQAEDLVQKCEKIKWDLWKRYRHASKLEEMNESLLRFVQFDLQLQIARNGVEALALMKGSEKGAGSSSVVPPEKCVAIGFDDRIRELKPMVLEDSPDGDCSIVVVSAAGGSGKTTLVTKLCHDPEIKERFGRNIYFVTVSHAYNKKVIIKTLLGERSVIAGDDAAIQQWGSFLGANKSEVLLVLDDVWSDSVIEDFKFKSPGYKVLVTSRRTFNQFKRYELPALNDEDATRLFHGSAFSEHGNEHSNIPDDLVHKIVKCCKNHPLVLCVVGGLLNGTHVANWEFMLKELSGENKSALDLDESILNCLEKSLYFFVKEDKMKQCYLDLGLFPEDQKIAATALLDMWAHLYKHDEKGLATTNILTNLASRNLATLLPGRKHLPNYCEEGSVTQHDMMRALAIHLSSQEPIEDRERLIINLDGQDVPELPQTVKARILSISTGVVTGEGFPLTWNAIPAPKVEVFVLNFMSNMHPLPQFMHNMKSLKVLIITNYGYYFSEIQNLPAPEYLSSLTRIRLDHVSISSISTTILELQNLQKLSLIMCKIGNSFNQGITSRLTSLVEIDIESCDDFITFPAILCNLSRLKKLSITNCHELTSLSEEFGKLSNLEVLRLASCSKLPRLPGSMRNLRKLRIIDLSHCLNLGELPLHIGELCSLQTIDATGCTGLHELPKSVKDFGTLKVVCDEEGSHLWSDFKNVKVELVEEDTLDTFFKIIPRGHNM